MRGEIRGIRKRMSVWVQINKDLKLHMEPREIRHAPRAFHSDETLKTFFWGQRRPFSFWLELLASRGSKQNCINYDCFQTGSQPLPHLPFVRQTESPAPNSRHWLSQNLMWQIQTTQWFESATEISQQTNDLRKGTVHSKRKIVS